MSFQCPHYFDGKCRRRKDADCKPGARYCILENRYEFPALKPDEAIEPNPLKEKFGRGKRTNKK